MNITNIANARASRAKNFPHQSRITSPVTAYSGLTHKELFAEADRLAVMVANLDDTILKLVLSGSTDDLTLAANIQHLKIARQGDLAQVQLAISLSRR